MEKSIIGCGTRAMGNVYLPKRLGDDAGTVSSWADVDLDWLVDNAANLTQRLFALNPGTTQLLTAPPDANDTTPAVVYQVSNNTPLGTIVGYAVNPYDGITYLHITNSGITNPADPGKAWIANDASLFNESQAVADYNANRKYAYTSVLPPAPKDWIPNVPNWLTLLAGTGLALGIGWAFVSTSKRQ